MADKKEQIEANIARINKLKQEILDARPAAEIMAARPKSVAAANIQFKNVKILMGHFGKIYAMDWGEGETEVLSAAQDGSLIVWNALSGNKLEVLNLRSSWVMSCAMSKTGRMTASGGLDNLVTIYKLPKDGLNPNSDLQSHRELNKHTGYISGAVFLNESKVISSSGDQTCILWDIETSAALNTFTGHKHDCMHVALLGDTGLFVSGSVDATCKVWDHRCDMKSQNVLTFTGHESDINAVDTIPENHYAFASGSDDHKLIVHDTRCYGPLQTYRADKIVFGVSSISFSKSGRYLFGGYDDQQARCWDTITGQLVSELAPQHQGRVSCLGVNVAGTAMVTGGWDQMLRVWA